METGSGVIVQNGNVERMGTCEVCDMDRAKYTCPACETRSCSLKCVGSHKKKLDCDGVRIRTSYVSLNKFTDLHLLNDYRLLEEIGRNVDKYGKDKLKRYTRFEQPLPKHLHRLKCAVMKRGTRFFVLPGHFARHKSNTTFLNWQTRKIFWRLQITFLNAEMLTFHEDRCPESTKLEDILQKYLSSTNPALKAYRKVGLESIDVLMKAEKVSGNSNRFYKLNLSDTLKDSLHGKCVVEYPQLFIAIQQFYSSKSEEEKQMQRKQLSGVKHNDFLQLKNTETKSDCTPTPAQASDSGDSSEDESTIPSVLGYRDLIQS